MLQRREVVEGFRHRNHGRIFSCLTDDVVWDPPGSRRLAGKQAFDGEIEGDPICRVESYPVAL